VLNGPTAELHFNTAYLQIISGRNIAIEKTWNAKFAVSSNI
jgi:hypothetical protein